MDPVAQRIFELAKKKFPEQKDFAYAIGVNPKTISAWKRGIKSYRKYISKIAEVLETTTDYLNYGIQPDSSTFTVEETELVIAYRQAGAETKAAARRVLGLKDVEPPAASEKAM